MDNTPAFFFREKNAMMRTRAPSQSSTTCIWHCLFFRGRHGMMGNGISYGFRAKPTDAVSVVESQFVDPSIEDSIWITLSIELRSYCGSGARAANSNRA